MISPDIADNDSLESSTLQLYLLGSFRGKISKSKIRAMPFIDLNISIAKRRKFLYYIETCLSFPSNGVKGECLSV